MADQSVNIQFSAADQNLLAMWDKMRKEGPEKTLESMKQLKGISKETDSSFKGMASNIISGLSLATVAQKAFNQVISEGIKLYQTQLQNQRDAATFQVSAASAQRAALRNLGQGEVSPQDLARRISEIGKGTGADTTSLYQAASGVLSARGKMSQTEALNQLAAVAKIDPSLASNEMQSMAGASLDIRKAYGGTAEQAVGAMLASQQTARVENTGQFAKNVVPALIGLKGFGGDFRTSSALVAAISQESADVEGASSGTAAIQLAKEVQQATAHIGALKDKGTAERLNWLMTDEGAQVRQQLMGSFETAVRKKGKNVQGELTGEAKQYVAMMGLMTRGSSARQAYEEALSATPTMEGAGALYQSNLDIQQGLGLQRTMKTHETFRAADQEFLSDARRGAVGATREGLEKHLTRLNSTGYEFPFQQMMEMGAYDKAVAEGQEPRMAAAAILARRGATAAGMGHENFQQFPTADLSGQDKVVRELQDLVKALKEQSQNVQKVDVVENGAARQDERTRPPQPPAAQLNPK